MICERRSSPYFVDDLGELVDDDLALAGLRWPGCPCSRRSRAPSSASSSMIFWRSRAARRRSCMSRIAVAWSSSMSSRPIRPWRASSTVGLRRIRAMTSSSASSALTRPRRMWARSSALRRRYSVRRRMTSIWCVIQLRDEPVEGQRARDVVDDRQHVRAEVRLQVGVLVEVVEHDPGDGVARSSTTMRRPTRDARLVAQRRAMPWTRPVVGQVGDLAAARLSGLTW